MFVSLSYESGINIGRRGSNCDITSRKNAEDLIIELNKELKKIDEKCKKAIQDAVIEKQSGILHKIYACIWRWRLRNGIFPPQEVGKGINEKSLLEAKGVRVTGCKYKAIIKK